MSERTDHGVGDRIAPLRRDVLIGFLARRLTFRPSGFILHWTMTKARNELRLITAAP